MNRYPLIRKGNRCEGRANLPLLLALAMALACGCDDREAGELNSMAGIGQGDDGHLADAESGDPGLGGAAGDAITDVGGPEAKSGSFGWKPRNGDRGCPGAAMCPCDANDECLSGFCLENASGKHQCASTCIDLCPDGFDCVTVGNHQGKKKVCRPSAPTPECEPGDEICDGKDNDCDGLIDDDCLMPACPLQVGFDSDPAGDVLMAGTPVAKQYGPWLLDIGALNGNAKHPDLAITFDSDNPTGGDADLATPNQHNLLIIAENEVDNDGNGLIDVPDDEAAGGELNLKFSKSVHVYGLRLVDIDEQGGTITVTFVGGVVEIFPIAALADGSIQDWTLNKGGVTRLQVKLAGSGAIDNLSYCPDAECVPGQEICDNQDNDCDGQVDEADGGDLCSDGDTCKAQGGCSHLAIDGACDDGNACTQGESCQAGSCGGGQGGACDDGKYYRGWWMRTSSSGSKSSDATFHVNSIAYAVANAGGLFQAAGRRIVKSWDGWWIQSDVYGKTVCK